MSSRIKVPKRILRIFIAQINYEKHIWNTTNQGSDEFVRLKHEWNNKAQMCFVAGMEYALTIMKDPFSFSGLQAPDQPPRSNKYKTLGEISRMMREVDNPVD